jgi:hypothetical protein
MRGLEEVWRAEQQDGECAGLSPGLIRAQRTTALEQQRDTLKRRMFRYPMEFGLARRSVGHWQSPCLSRLAGASVVTIPKASHVRLFRA